MKKVVALFLIPFLFNCGASKSNLKESQEWISSQNFTVDVPEHWRPFYHHNHVGYTPLKPKENPFTCLVSIFEYSSTEGMTLKELFEKSVQSSNKVLNILSQEALMENNHLGDVYIHKYETYLEKWYVVYFKHDGKYYNYSYSASPQLYGAYFEEAMAILNSIKFKQEIAY